MPISRTLIPQLLPDGVEVTKMVPREKEGGAFVYFRAPPTFVLQVGRESHGVSWMFGQEWLEMRVVRGVLVLAGLAESAEQPRGPRESSERP